MKQLAEVTGLPLQWMQPSAWREAYELRAGDDVVATLRFRSAFGSFAVAETAEACWTFKRVGFWTTRVTVRQCGSDDDLAVFHNNTWDGGGTLQFPDGRRYPASTNFWQTRYELQTDAGEPLVRFDIGGVFRQSAGVIVQPAAVRLAELPLLITLGWYLAVMMHQDSSAAAVVVAA
jgi:hypothetical protein